MCVCVSIHTFTQGPRKLDLGRTFLMGWGGGHRKGQGRDGDRHICVYTCLFTRLPRVQGSWN